MRGKKVCGTKDVQSPRGSLPRACRSRRRNVQRLEGGLDNQRRNRHRCPLNASSGWMPSDLFGTHARSAWEEGFAALKKFKAREGHCLVPDGHVEGTFKLGQWVRYSATLKTVCPLNASNVCMPSDLFGMRGKSMGGGLCGAKEVSKPARVTVPCLRVMLRATINWGRGSVLSG